MIIKSQRKIIIFFKSGFFLQAGSNTIERRAPGWRRRANSTLRLGKEYDSAPFGFLEGNIPGADQSGCLKKKKKRRSESLLLLRLRPAFIAKATPPLALLVRPLAAFPRRPLPSRSGARPIPSRPAFRWNSRRAKRRGLSRSSAWAGRFIERAGEGGGRKKSG